MSGFYDGVRVAVTGAGGFIGRRLVAALDAAGADVVQLGRADMDLERPDDAAAAVAETGAAVLFHLAAGGVGDLFADVVAQMRINALGTAAVLEGARRAKVERVVAFGTCFEYAPSFGPLSEDAPLSPRNPYAVSKMGAYALARHAADVLGEDIVWLRPFAVYGPGQPSPKLVPSLIEAATSGRPLDLGPGEAAWDYVHADDVAAAALIVGRHPGAARAVFNAGTGMVHSARDIAARIERLAGRKAALNWGARPARPGDPLHLAADAARLRALGWAPSHTIDSGLEALVAAHGRAA